MTPELLGLAEVAELLKTSPRQALRWSKRGDFPPPLVRLRATPVWGRSAIERWASKHPKATLRPGRPRRRAR